MRVDPEFDRGVSSTPVQPFPRLTARLLSRPALFRRLDRLAALTLVKALAGFGKTHLVGSWAKGLRDTGAVVEWIDASAELNSPEILQRHVQRAIDRATTDEGATDNEGTVVVVIDNADCIDDPTSIDLLLKLLTRLPRLHFVVCSGYAHPLQAAAEQLSIDLHVLTGRDLILTRDELPQFVASRGHDFSPERLGELHDLTGGWMQLTRLVLDDTSAGAEQFSVGAAERYLRAFVLPQIVNEPGMLTAFRLAVPRILTPAVVRLLLAGPADDIVHGVQRSPESVLGTFVRVGALERVGGQTGGRMWRFPGLIRTVLLDEFATRNPLAEAETHCLLARHYAGADARSLGDALTHACAGQDWAFLNQIVCEQAFTLTSTGSAEAIAAFSSLPDEVLERFPSLSFARSMVEALWRSSDDDEGGRTLLRSYISVAEGNLADLTAFDSVAKLCAVAVAEVISLRSAGFIDQAGELAGRIASELAGRRNRGEIGDSSEQVAWFHFQWSMTALLAGDLERSTRLSFEAFETARDDGNDLVASNAAAQLALIHTLGGESTDAERWLEVHRGFDTNGSVTDYLIGVPARIAGVHRALDSLDSDAAIAELLAAGDAAQELEMWAFIAEAASRHALLFAEPIAMLARLGHLAVVHARVLAGGGHARRAMEREAIDLLLAMGELNRASQRLVAAEREGRSFAVQNARLHLIAGNHDQAQKLAASGVWDAAMTVRDQIDLLMIAAVAQLSVGDHSAAVTSFTRAHALAGHVRTLIPYALIPAEDREALLQLSQIELLADARARVAQIRTVYPRRAQLIVLTGREEAVLAELARTDSFAAIATTLTVSVNTVKKQAASVYSKLGVHDRLAALARAHQLGLLDSTSSV